MTRKTTRNYSLSARAKVPLNIFDGGPRFGSTKLAAAAIRGALTLAVLAALLLIAAFPAQAQTETVLYNFYYGSDGAYPIAHLTSDGAGNLYGTTCNYEGGGPGYGTVFELSPNGSGGWKETVLYSFTGGADGSNPIDSGVIFDSVGNLYGTTYQGGANGLGVVFELSPVGGSWTETVLYSFAGGADGANPLTGVIMDRAGNLYGTVSSGAVFELTPSGGGWTEQVIYATEVLEEGLTMDAAGNIFGAGDSGVFELSPNGNGGWSPTVIYTFCGYLPRPCGPVGTLVLDQAGNLYGTTDFGGSNDNGTVYKLSIGTKGKWTGAILHSFLGGTDGRDPFAGVVLDAAGDIYGTTHFGGKSDGGTVYELVALFGTTSYREKLLWSFSGWDGYWPLGSLILDSSGKLYGTTVFGGSSGQGVAFEVAGVPATTTTTLTSLPNPSASGQAVTFTAVVASNAGVPPGGETVSFMEGSTVLGTGTLSSGSASFTTSALPVGVNAIMAVYGGDSKFPGSKSNTVKQVVGAAVVKPTSLTFGPQPLNTTSPAKRISLFNTSSIPITVTSVNVQGDFAISVNTCENGVRPDTHCDVYVTYTPTGTGTAPRTGTITFVDTAFNSPQSAPLSGTVPYPTKTSVSTSGSPSLVGQAVTFTATVTSTHGTIPDGELVTFYDGTTALGSAALTSETAMFTTSSLSAKTHTIKATYAGDAAFVSSTGLLWQVVDRYPTTTALGSSSNPSAYGQAVTFTAAVTSAGPTPTGKVWFEDGTTGIATVTLSGGVATFTKSKLAVGTHPITAEYLGDAANAKSTSAVLDQVVQ
jgi:uncharacterized repeat protein (TIGR03803 family)